MNRDADINIFYLGDLRIDEPIVTLTDLIVSALCIFFFFKLHRAGNTSRASTFFKYYFLTMGLATFFGGIAGHAFLYALSLPWKLPGWITSMFSIMLIERAAIEHTQILFKPKLIRVLRIINVIELSTFMALTLYFLSFSFVEFHSGYGLMFVVLSLEGYLFLKTKNPASKSILIGIGLAAVAALFFMNKWIIHPWFNHISMSHTLMAVAAFFFYAGATKIDMSIGKEASGRAE